ncbi:MAG: hypothetical protein N2512_02680 [Armatimonadetes bacterium]|nr:hypothetical protein [Armatimonadota bacterium]
MRHAAGVLVAGVVGLVIGLFVFGAGEARAASLVAPEAVSARLIQDDLYLRRTAQIQLSARLVGDELAWQQLMGKQEKDRPPQYVRVWVRSDGRGGVQLLGRRAADLNNIGIDLHWPQITYEPLAVAGQGTQALPRRAEGSREHWILTTNPKKSDNYAIGCDLGPAPKFTRRRVTWTAEYHQWQYDPPTGLGDLSKPAEHRFTVLYALLELSTDGSVNPAGEPVEITPTCDVDAKSAGEVFALYRVEAFGQSPYWQLCTVPAYPGTAYWGPPAGKGDRQPHLFVWLFPRVDYKILVVYVMGLNEGYEPLTTLALLQTRVLDCPAKEEKVSRLELGNLGHSSRTAVTGPVWHCGLSPNLCRIDPDGAISPLDVVSASLYLWVDGVRPGQAQPQSLDEAVSWDEELMWAGGARIAYVGVITGEVPPGQVDFYRRWVQRVKSLGYKAAVGWNCAEVFTDDYTYQKRPHLVAKTADGKDVVSPGLRFRGVILNWLSMDWQKWAADVARQFFNDIGFDYVCLDWAPINQTYRHHLLTPVDGTMADARRKTSLSTGNPWFFTWLAKEWPGRVFMMGDSQARDFQSYTAPPVGRGFFSWNRVMTESAGWLGGEAATKAMAFERWCQMAAMRMAYVGVPSFWTEPAITGVACYLGQPGMKVLRTYSDIVSRMEKECWGLCMDVPATMAGEAAPGEAVPGATGEGFPSPRTTASAPQAWVRVFLPRGWARGRLFVLAGSDRDCTLTVNLPLISGRYMVCDLATNDLWSAEGPLTIEISHKNNLLHPTGGLRPLLVQQLR